MKVELILPTALKSYRTEAEVIPGFALAETGTEAAIATIRVLNLRTNAMQKTKCSHTPSKNHLFVVVSSLIVGSFALAWVDQGIRATFADLAKVGVGGYIALMVPTGSDRRDGSK